MHRNYFRFIFLALIFRIDIVFAEDFKLKDIYPQKPENCNLSKASNKGCVITNGDKDFFYFKGIADPAKYLEYVAKGYITRGDDNDEKISITDLAISGGGGAFLLHVCSRQT